MTRLRTGLAGGLAAATLGAGSVLLAPSAQAAPSSSAPASESDTGETSSSAASSSAASTSTAAAADAEYCENTPPPSAPIEPVPWHQKMLDVPERIAPYSTGAGVTVAVIDTGVDAANAQLAGKVLTGYDLHLNRAGADQDCSPNGTGMAGIIAASQLPGVGSFGMAPGVSILPIRISDTAVSGAPDRSQLPPSRLAEAIDIAVESGAKVVVIGLSYFGSGDPALEAAVNDAYAAGVVVVSGTGDQQPGDDKAFVPVPAELIPYPAAYDHVIGVGSIGPDRTRDQRSEIGGFVDIVAPGQDVVSTGIGGSASYQGSAFAASFVAGTAALVIGAAPAVIDPALSGPQLVDAVTARILGTASPSPGDGVEMGYGAGIVDPYRALTDTMTGTAPEPGATYAPYTSSSAEIAEARAVERADHRSGLLALAAFGATCAVGALAWMWARGRRRGWRAGAVSEAQLQQVEPEPEFMSGEKLFAPKEID